MGRGNSLSSRSERKRRKLCCPSLIPARGCPHSRRSRSSMLSLPLNLTAPAWGFASAAPSWNRMAAAYGLPTTLPAAQASISRYPPKSRPANDAPRPQAWTHKLALHSQFLCPVLTFPATISHSLGDRSSAATPTPLPQPCRAASPSPANQVLRSVADNFRVGDYTSGDPGPGSQPIRQRSFPSRQPLVQNVPGTKDECFGSSEKRLWYRTFVSAR